MALRWIEGFEGISIPSDGHARIYELSGTTNMFSEDGAEISTQEAVSGDDQALRTKPIVTVAQNSWIVGFAFRPDEISTVEGTQGAYFAWRNDAGEQCRIEAVDVDPADARPQGRYYKWRLMRGATELCATNESFWIGTREEGWVYFEFKVTIDDAAGSVAGRFKWIRKPSLNPGGAYTTFTWDAANSGLDTQDQVTTGANRVEIGIDTGNTNIETAWDDIYVCDSTGAKNNDYLGRVVIVPQKPAGEGDTTSWAFVGAISTEDALNEPAATVSGIEDDKRITSDTISQVHLHTVAAIVGLGANSTIVGVRHDLIGKMETSGDLDIAHMFRKTTATVGETSAGTPMNVDSTTYEGSSVILEDDPNTLTDWALSDLNSYQYGCRNDG